MVCPLAFLGVWGYSYLAACLQTLSAPGKPLEFRYVSAEGALQLRIESFVFTLEAGHLRANGITLRDPEGDLLANADLVTATGLKLLALGEEPVVVDVANVYGKVELLPTGLPKFLVYLPEPTEEPTVLPFSVRAKNVKVDVVEAAGHLTTLTTSEALVDGIGRNWLARATPIRMSGQGVIRAEARQDDDVLEMKADLRGAQLARLLRFFATTDTGRRVEALQKLAADHIVGGAFAVVRVEKDQRPKLLANVNVAGQNVRYGSDYQASSASFEGTVTDAGARGVALAEMQGADLRFNGAIRWTDTTTLAGHAEVWSAGSASLPQWMRRELPRGAAYSNGSFDGWVSYTSGSGLRADGHLAAATATFRNETVRDARLRVHVDPDRVAGRIDRLAWQGRSLTGVGEYGLDTERIAAAVSAQAVPIRQVARQFDVQNVGGTADLRLLVSGTLDRPIANLQAKGTATASVRTGRTLRLGGFNVLASLVGDVATVERLSVQGPNGVLSASGTINLANNRMDLSVLSSGIPLQRVADDVRGTLAMTAKVGGTFDNPRVTGRAEIYNGAFQDRQVPAVFADLSLANNRIIASNVQAVAEGVQANGFVAYNTRTDRLDGRLNARLFLRDVLGEAAAGVADVEVADIGGTLTNPTAVARAAIGKSFFADVEVDGASAEARISKSGVAVTDLSAQLGEGRVTGSGRYNFDTRSGSYIGSALAIPIERLTVQVADTAKLEGLIDANNITASLGPEGLRTLTAGGAVRNLEINDTLFDGGPWDVTASNHVWRGSATLGVLERYVQVSDFTFNDQTRVLDADVSALDLDIKPLVAMARPYLSAPTPDQSVKPIARLSPQAMEKVESLSGLVSAALSVSGPLDNLAITEGIVNARNLALGERLAGDLDTNFTLADELWTVNQFVFAGPVGRLEVTGSIHEKGQTNLDGELKNLDINWLSIIDPDLAAVAGFADLSFLVSGLTQQPNVAGTLDARLLEEEVPQTNSASPTQERTRIPNLVFSIPFTLSHQATADDPDAYLLQANGNVNYKVFKGTMSAEVPFDSIFKISEERPWNASIVSTARDITPGELRDYLPTLDPARTNLRASGELRAQGTGRNYGISGAVALWKKEDAPPGSSAIGIRGVDTSLTALDANAKLSETGLAVTVDADSSEGGSVQTRVNLGLGNVEELLNALVAGNTEPLFNQPLSGSITFSDFGIDEGQIVEGTEGDPGSGFGQLNGTILVGQTLGTPLFRTAPNQPLLVSAGDFVLPTLPEAEAGALAMRVVPHFDLDVALADPARMRAGNTTLTVVGGGTVGGSLLLPTISAEMQVLEGLVRLPTARVRIEQGGALNLQYRAREDGDPVSRLDVDLEGNTSLTALRFGNVVERYSVHLRMTGDLLSDVPINIQATSDPADLSQDQILRLLGQADVLESLTASVRSSLGDPAVRTAIGTFAVPALFDPITEQLATNLGLDYLSVEYNALEHATITAAKTLGRGLTLQFRRQLFEPPAGQRQRFDLRLSYRLPTRNPLLSRVTFSVGMDQDRPYKIAVEYSTRF